MPHRITEECLACGTCLEVCPQEAISEGDPIFVIDPEKCIDCGICADECPQGCIVEE